MPSSAHHPNDNSETAKLRGSTEFCFRWRLALAGVLAIVLVSSGCQTFHPFAQKTREKISSARQWANNGLEAFQNGHLEKAKGLFSRASQQNPSDYRIRADLARTLYQSGDQAHAIAEMTKAVELSRNDPKLLVALGQMHLGVGQTEQAQRQVALALDSDYRFAPAFELSGRIAKSKGDFQTALADFQKSLGYTPDVTSVQLEIVDTYQRMGEPLRALSAVDQVLSKLSLDQQPESVLIAKSAALIQLKQLSPAIDLLQTASQRAGASSDVFVRLGHAQLLAGDTAGSRNTISRGQQSFPHLPLFQQLAQAIAPQTAAPQTAQIIVEEAATNQFR